MGQTEYPTHAQAAPERHVTSARRFEGTGLAGQAPGVREITPTTTRPLEPLRDEVSHQLTMLLQYSPQPAKAVPSTRPQLVAERKAPPPPKPPAPTVKSSIDSRTAPVPAQPTDSPPVASRTQPGDSSAAVAPPTATTRQAERRISTMNEAQIMDKLRSVVSSDNPKDLYHKIKKVGQGFVLRQSVN